MYNIKRCEVHMNSYFQDLVNSTLELVAYDSVQATPCKESPFGMGVAQSLEKILDIAKSFGFKIQQLVKFFCRVFLEQKGRIFHYFEIIVDRRHESGLA